MITLHDIFGQERAVKFLESAMLAGRLPHGLIFAGPMGVGKGTCAAALAGAFLCENANGAQGCGRCDSCRLLPSGTHPDYHLITKELIRFHDKSETVKAVQFSVKVIREDLIAHASRKSVMGRGKVFVVEEADLMNASAQNALLKTLEEPEGRTLIVLLTDMPHCLLPTVHSRCQMVPFGVLDDVEVERRLVAMDVDPELAHRAAVLAEGSIGGAKRLIDDDVIEPATRLGEQIDALVAGRAPADLPGWFKAASEAYAVKQQERDPLSSKDAGTRAGLALYLRLASTRLASHLRGAPPEVMEHICVAIDSVALAEKYLEANVNVAIALQDLSQEWAGALQAH